MAAVPAQAAEKKITTKGTVSITAKTYDLYIPHAAAEYGSVPAVKMKIDVPDTYLYERWGNMFSEKTRWSIDSDFTGACGGGGVQFWARG